MHEEKDWDYRFAATDRLYGQGVLQCLRQSSAMVIGLGGVGSWSAEALVRAGLGQIHLVDYDEVCLSNTNRQIQAMSSTVGQLKAEALKQRFLQISPHLEVVIHDLAFDENTCEKLLGEQPHVVIDAIDSQRDKCRLLSECRAKDIPVVTCGGAGGKQDPSFIRVEDLARSYGDKMLYQIRKRLRKEYRFPRGKKSKFNIPAVFSCENTWYQNEEGVMTQDPEVRPEGVLDCAAGLGTSAAVTGSFGFFMASEAIKLLLSSSFGEKILKL